jgi:transcriptional regulator with GAF, ATPase, and Fis domain
MEGRMSVNINDLNRLDILNKVKEGYLKQSKAARILGISPRQIRCLLRKLRLEGPKGVLSGKLGAH